MSALVYRFDLLLCAALLLSGCGADTQQVQQSKPNIVDARVGVHDLRFALPNDFQHLDLGATHTIRGAGVLLEFEDLGTFSPSGIKTQIKAARQLFENGDALAAQQQLKNLPSLQVLFLNSNEWHEAQPSWRLLTQRQHAAKPAKVTASYHQLLTILDYQPNVDFAAVVTWLLELEDRNDQREAADRKTLSISARNAIQIKTWDKLSHAMRKTYLYVLNGDNILLLSVKLGAEDAYSSVFDEIVASMEFV